MIINKSLESSPPDATFLIELYSSFILVLKRTFNISIPKNLINFIDGNPDNLHLDKKAVDLIAGTTSSILLKNIETYEKNGFEDFQNKWNRHMFGRNENVTLQSKDQKISGKLIGINSIGALQIEENGKIVSISDINYSMRIL